MRKTAIILPSFLGLAFILGLLFYLLSNSNFKIDSLLAKVNFFSKENFKKEQQPLKENNSEIEELKNEISILKENLKIQETAYRVSMKEISENLENLTRTLLTFQKKTVNGQNFKPEDCKINLNRATIEELQKLIGVGPALAQKIIEARPFFSVYELIKVPGIGEKTLQKILEQGCAYIESEEEEAKKEEKKEKTTSPCPVDINTATKEELQAIVGVGPVLAEKIILARPFFSINDLLRVSGIGEKTLQKIIEQNCVIVGKTTQTVSSISGSISRTSISDSGTNSTFVSYPKIIISEVKIAEKSGDKNVFIELYNPNNFEVDLINWYIFKNDNSFITKTLFQNKKILPNSHFLLTRTGSLWQEKADILFDGALERNTKISLKNPKGEIVDELSWTEIPADKSLGRIYEEQNQSYSSSWEIQALTPKEKNNRLPIAIFSVLAENLFVGEEIIFNASSSTDPDGQINSFIWNFNDGKTSTTSNPVISHIFTNSGNFQIELLVVDKRGALSFPVTTTIEIKNKPKPILKISPLSLNFRGEKEEQISAQILTIENVGDKELNWIAINSLEWILLSTNSGTIPPFSSTTISIFVNTLNLPIGKSVAKIQIKAPETENGLQDVSLAINLFPKTLKTVIINEIAWMGTKGNSSDEWIELFNNTSSTIDISGWILKAQDNIPTIIFPKSTNIPAFGYFLLERTDDNTISDIKADFIYSGALSNTGESLELWDQEGNLIDLVDCSQGWFAGKASPDYVSMERIDPNLPGSYSDNWTNNNLQIRNGTDSGGNPINGTPKSQNSIELN